MKTFLESGSLEDLPYELALQVEFGLTPDEATTVLAWLRDVRMVLSGPLLTKFEKRFAVQFEEHGIQFESNLDSLITRTIKKKFKLTPWL